jgi:hypothetical protein
MYPGEVLVVEKYDYVVLLGEMAGSNALMFLEAPFDIVGHADVKVPYGIGLRGCRRNMGRSDAWAGT